MSAHHSFVYAHTLIDNIENEIKDKYGIDLLIHVDPIDESCHVTSFAKEKLEEILKNYDSIKGMHDFRVVNERGKKTVVFDMVVEDKMKTSDVVKLREKIEMDFYKIDKSYKLVIKIEKENTFIEI